MVGVRMMPVPEGRPDSEIAVWNQGEDAPSHAERTAPYSIARLQISCCI